MLPVKVSELVLNVSVLTLLFRVRLPVSEIPPLIVMPAALAMKILLFSVIGPLNTGVAVVVLIASVPVLPDATVIGSG